MTRDEKIYFSLLRIGLGTESPREILPELAKLQWGEIYRLAVRQGTGALIWDALRQLHAMDIYHCLCVCNGPIMSNKLKIVIENRKKYWLDCQNSMLPIPFR